MKESEEEIDTDEDKESLMKLPSSPDHGQMIHGDSSDESSVSSAGYCCVCDRPGPRGLMCTSDGCEDSNCIYE